MLQFTKSNDGVRRATLTVRTSVRLDVETMAKLWLADDVDKAPPASKRALEKEISASVREYGAYYEGKVGVWWDDNVRNPGYYDQAHVEAQLAATITAIRYLYEE